MPDSPSPTLAVRAHAVIHEHLLLSAATALIPEPILCTTALTGVHLRLVAELSELYSVPFSPKAGRALLIAAGAGIFTRYALARPFVRRAVAAFAPILLPIWFIGGSVIAAGFTHFLGQAIVRHYEAGGTFADFDWGEFRRDTFDRLGLPGPSRPAAAAVPA
jgi:uncharacterized protein (DUF697 family)